MTAPASVAPPASPSPSVDPAAARRLLGVDVARAVAQLGMLIAHYAYLDGTGGDLRGVSRFVGGKAMPLFVLLGGVGFTFLTRRARHPVAQVLARAAVLLVVGLLLVEHAPYIAVILQFYAGFFALGLVVRRLSSRWLVGVAVAVAAVGAWTWSHVAPDRVRYGGWAGWETVTDPRPLAIDLFVSGSYPALPTFAFFLVGMTVGRMPLHRPAVPARLAISGLVLALTGLVVGEAVTRATTDRAAMVERSGVLVLAPATARAVADRVGWTDADVERRVAESVERRGSSRRDELRAVVREHERASGAVPFGRIADPVGHGKMPAWVIGATGWSLLVLGASLLAAGRWPRLLHPVAMAGQLALTFYVLQALGLRWWYTQEWSQRYSYTGQLVACLVIFGAFAVAATAWRRVLPRGPLEAVLRAAGLGAAALAERVRPVPGVEAEDDRVSAPR